MTTPPISKIEIFRIDSSQYRVTWYLSGSWDPEGTRHFESILEAAAWIILQESDADCVALIT